MSSSMVAESALTKPLIAALVVAEVVEDSVVDKVATRAARAARADTAAARAVDTVASRAADTAAVVSSPLWNRHIRIANMTRTNRILESQQFFLKFVSSVMLHYMDG